ncbi:MAG: signal peptidase I [Muribaculaceae bacterium]|nr:signal peptidase I [Muribaculaceae bacterium]
MDKNLIITDFKRRLHETKTTRWLRFALVAIIFLAWVAWLGSWWVAIFLILLFDIYITGYIPLTWWKESKNKIVRSVMSWVDAIVYALILVYFVFSFVGQNYQIPSSSLEKSLLVGDYLWVNKMAYGPRVPMTPIHFPLVQNTFPIINTKSYTDWPQWEYKRLKGLGNVQRGDIVVFNFPAGDTVTTKVTNPDYYTLVEMLGRNAVIGNKEQFGDVIYRPVDRRENYVKRCVGLPGERFKIVDGVIYNNGVEMKQPENVQFNYFFQTTGNYLTEQDWERLGISVDDRNLIDVRPADIPNLRALGFKINENNSIPPIYQSPLTPAMVKMLESDSNIATLMKVPVTEMVPMFPSEASEGWTRADYGEIWIPKKGETIDLTPRTWAMYNRCIRNYEGHHDAFIKDGKVYIDGKEAKTYTFEMDYYFMMGDNRDNSADSRYWGFVPEDHIVGKPWRVLVSFDKDKGGIRWNRIFKNANPDKFE